MKYLNLSFPDPAQNLACEEALLDFCEENDPGEILRIWESAQYFVVAGYSNKIHSEVNLDSCNSGGIPVLRRPSGGGTVLQGPGCLNYSLILKIDKRPSLKNITETNRYVLERHREMVEKIFLGSDPNSNGARPQNPVLNITVEGHSDLALDGLKFSGNAQRRKKNYVLFHGTFLLDFDITRIEKFLPMPSKAPSYRQGRSHKDFLTNLPLPKEKMISALKDCWGVVGARHEKRGQAEGQNDCLSPFFPEGILFKKIEELVETRYACEAWNFKW